MSSALSHTDQELSKVIGVRFDSLLTGVALNDHGLVEDQAPPALVISPDPATLRERSSTSEVLSEHLKSLVLPVSLVNPLILSIDAGDEQH